jgi:hypothetical protein
MASGSMDPGTCVFLGGCVGLCGYMWRSDVVEVLGGTRESHEVHRFIHHSSSIKLTRALPPIQQFLLDERVVWTKGWWGMVQHTTLYPVNPMCPYAPTATFMFDCPTRPPYVVWSCSTTDTITFNSTTTVGDCVTITPPPLDCSPTGPGIPFPDSTTIGTEPTPPPSVDNIPDPCETEVCR